MLHLSPRLWRKHLQVSGRLCNLLNWLAMNRSRSGYSPINRTVGIHGVSLPCREAELFPGYRICILLHGNCIYRCLGNGYRSIPLNEGRSVGTRTALSYDTNMLLSRLSFKSRLSTHRELVHSHTSAVPDLLPNPPCHLIHNRYVGILYHL